MTSPINAGDGSPSGLVDNSRRIGQAGATHYIQLANTTDMTQFAENDIVTVHVLRAAGIGGGNPLSVTNGVDFTDGTVQNLRIAVGGIDSVDYRLSFTTPIMVPFTTDLGGGVYAYVTKGVHIHANIFIGGPDSVSVGVGRPLAIHTPMVVDDMEALYRVTWDIYAGWQNYNPFVAEIVFTASSTRVVGGMLQ